MKIALFSDVHGNLQALNAVLDSIKEEKVDKIICLGDVIAIGPNSRECLDLIIDNKITLLLGNHEIYYLYGPEKVADPSISQSELEHQEFIKNQLTDKHYNFLKNCPINLIINYKDKKIHLAHFLIKDKTKILPFYPLNILKEDYDYIIDEYGADYIFIGHKHMSFKEKIYNTEFIDIGSCGARRNEITSYYILELKDGINYEEKVINYDREAFINTMNEANYPNQDMIKRIFFGIK